MKPKQPGGPSLQVLQRGLTGERGLIGSRYMDDEALLRAYTEYYLPVSLEQTRFILHRISSLFPAGFSRLVDVGSGPGSVAAAFVEAGTRSICLVDQSEKALASARNRLEGLCAGGEPGGHPEVECVKANVSADVSALDGGLPAKVGGVSIAAASCVSFGHSLNELWSGEDDRIERRAALLEGFASLLAPDGIILVIEPALLSTSRDLIAVRNLLVSRGWRVLAPCPGRYDLPCPVLGAGESHTCHEEVPWKMPSDVARLAASLGVDKDLLKMAWFVFAPPGSRSLARAGRHPWDGKTFRVVSDPLLNKAGRTRHLVCGREGRIPLSAPGDGDSARKSGFSALKRGDLVRISGALPRENGLGVGPDTRIVAVE